MAQWKAHVYLFMDSSFSPWFVLELDSELSDTLTFQGKNNVFVKFLTLDVSPLKKKKKKLQCEPNQTHLWGLLVL